MEKYDFVKEISQGAFSTGNLYEKKNKQYAIKIPNNNDFCQLCNELREIMILSVLNDHQNIINIQNIICNNFNRINLVYDFYKMNLRQYIKDTDKNERHEYVNSFLQQLLSAVHYIHSKNIIHADLKDSNILIDRTDGFKIIIIDFGSSIINNLTNKNVLISTYTVRAPEIYKYDYNYNHKIDIWAIGVLLFSFLTGYELLDTYIHENTNDIQKLDDIILFVSNINKLQIDDKYKNLLKYMLDIDKDTRYDINNIIIKFQDIFNLTVNIKPYSDNNNNFIISDNKDLFKLNKSCSLRLYDINISNLYIGSIILNKMKKYKNIDVLCAWYLTYLIIQNDSIDNISHFINIFNNHFNSTFSELDIKNNCLEILKTINFKLI